MLSHGGCAIGENIMEKKPFDSGRHFKNIILYFAK